MSQRGSVSQVTRLLAWMPYMLLGALLLALVRTACAPVSNADTFFHLRFGHEFLHGWSLRHPGHVSSFGHRDWAPTQWASQILMALMESVFGLAGVAWLTGTVVLVTVVAIFQVSRKYADPLPAVVVTLVAVVSMMGNLTGRPQVVSFLLVLVTTHAWLRTAEDLRPRWWLVPVTWVWAMLHGLWPIGVVIGLVVVLGIALDHRERLREFRPALLRLLAVPALSLVAAGLTPVGPRLYGAVLLVGGRAKFHDEWGATSFRDPQSAVVAAMVALILVVWLLRRQDGRSERPGQHGQVAWVPVLMLLLAAASCAYAFRFVPVAAVMTVPLAAGAVQSLVGRRRPAPRHERAVVLATALAAVTVLAVLVPFTADRPASVPPWVNPALDRLPDGTAVQTTDVMGGYLMWRHPELDPVIDGYSDAYTTKHLQAELDLMALRPGWDTSLRASRISYALLPTRSPLAYALPRFAHWRVLHTSKDVVMLAAPDGWVS